ncbi:nuclear transport factor 2 family protein [Methyloversatilis sp.]|uniref:nuclear transport factor 2 family protein n=1 Tax=Methyloversatilis sp. TaxID=2569862 RepID=UPI0035AF0C31
MKHTARHHRTALMSALVMALSGHVSVVAAAGNASSPAHSTQKAKVAHMTSESKTRVASLLKAIETGESGPVSAINPNKYIQHNLAVADGLSGFGAVLQALPKGSARVNTVRIFQDGDFVFAHTEYDFFGPRIGFDIFRFEDGRIVEHWDNLQPTPAAPNPSGRTMTDGPTTPGDLDRTDENKALVKAFVDDILVGGKTDRLAGYFNGDDYRQHNPNIADGLSGLGAALQAMAKANVTMKYARVHKVLGEGNFVLVVSEGEFAGQPTSFYDLFRVEAGKIAEHWDTMETVSPQSEWRNANGKFGF